MMLWRYACKGCGRVYFVMVRKEKVCPICGYAKAEYLGHFSTLTMDGTNEMS
jgi:rRNA maturation endonuclease Nob1